MEFIAPDQQSFIQAFGINIDNLDAFFTAWDPLVRMGGYNKFAIAAADLSGTWSSSFSGVTQYVNVNTGNSAGMDTHSSSQTFEFQGVNAITGRSVLPMALLETLNFSRPKVPDSFLY